GSHAQPPIQAPCTSTYVNLELADVSSSGARPLQSMAAVASNASVPAVTMPFPSPCFMFILPSRWRYRSRPTSLLQTSWCRSSLRERDAYGDSLRILVVHTRAYGARLCAEVAIMLMPQSLPPSRSVGERQRPCQSGAAERRP